MPGQTREDTCCLCKWYEPFDGKSSGCCRRNAPMPLLGERKVAVWPTVQGSKDWCGQFESLLPPSK